VVPVAVDQVGRPDAAVFGKSGIRASDLGIQPVQPPPGAIP